MMSFQDKLATEVATGKAIGSSYQDFGWQFSPFQKTIERIELICDDGNLGGVIQEGDLIEPHLIFREHIIHHNNDRL
jgi:hypothetical protein